MFGEICVEAIMEEVSTLLNALCIVGMRDAEPFPFLRIVDDCFGKGFNNGCSTVGGCRTTPIYSLPMIRVVDSTTDRCNDVFVMVLQHKLLQCV
eukprot:scaffold336_cov196-Amphora_coffeaeformis.AAC.7